MAKVKKCYGKNEFIVGYVQECMIMPNMRSYKEMTGNKKVMENCF